MRWSSNNAGVASVDSVSGEVHGVAEGGATITATSEGKSGTATVTVDPAPVATVTVSPSAPSITAVDSVQLNATVKDADGNQLTGRSVSWSSDNTAAATVVAATGKVHGVSAGSATITATSEGKSGTASVTVTQAPVASVTVTPSAPTIAVGDSVPLAATLKDAKNRALTGRDVSWSSDNTSVATVGASTGMVHGLSEGSATITATSEGQTGTASVTVTPAAVASVDVTPSSASITAVDSVQLTATPRDASNNPLTGRSVTWMSDALSVATVDPDGLVHAVAEGSATITATSESVDGTASVTVTPAPVDSILVTPSAASVAVGDSVQLNGTPIDAKGRTLAGRTISWVSDTPTIAVVDATTGMVHGVAEGSATVTAAAEGKNTAVPVTVTPSVGP